MLIRRGYTWSYVLTNVACAICCRNSSQGRSECNLVASANTADNQLQDREKISDIPENSHKFRKPYFEGQSQLRGKLSSSDTKPRHIRASYVDNLWLKDGSPVDIHYAFKDKMNDEEQEKIGIFTSWINIYTEKTCIKFVKADLTECNSPSKHKIIKVQLGDACGAGLGMKSGCTNFDMKRCKKGDTHRHILIMLGFQPYAFRKESTQYLSVSDENFAYDLFTSINQQAKQSMSNFYKCFNQTENLPTTFDLFSPLMETSLTEYGDKTEGKPVLVTKRSEYQHLLDYPRLAQLGPSFYDYYAINIVYKCSQKWRKDCAEDGKFAPPCENGGFLTKECKCKCSPGFEGTACESEEGVPQEQLNVKFLTISREKRYDLKDLKMTLIDRSYNEYLIYYQFAIIFLDHTDRTQLASVKIYLQLNPKQELFKNHTTQENFIDNIAAYDCDKGMRLLWGSAKHGKMDCACASEIITGEKETEARVLRSRHPSTSLHLINGFGSLFQNANLTLETSQFQITVTFQTYKRMKVRDENPFKKDVEYIFGKKGGNIAYLILIIVALTVTVIAIAAVSCVIQNRKKGQKSKGISKEKNDEEEEEDEDTDSTVTEE